MHYLDNSSGLATILAGILMVVLGFCGFNEKIIRYLIKRNNIFQGTQTKIVPETIQYYKYIALFALIIGGVLLLVGLSQTNSTEVSTDPYQSGFITPKPYTPSQ